MTEAGEIFKVGDSVRRRGLIGDQGGFGKVLNIERRSNGHLFLTVVMPWGEETFVASTYTKAPAPPKRYGGVHD